MSIPLEDIYEYREAKEYALGKLASFIKTILPEHKIIRADRNSTIPVEKYITVRPMATGGLNPSGMGNYAIFKEVDKDGVESNVFQYSTNVQLKTYKGYANEDMEYLRESLSSGSVTYEIIGRDPLVGITNIGIVTNTPTPIDQQETEPGATMNLSVTFIAKRTNSYFGVIDKVTGVTKTDSEGNIIEEGFDVEKPTA
ncbi:hypothetical protein VP277E431_P0047 [Vibrio phage 277E43-1]|nr:hypothetical protein VP277E431_P0047 [Vibrio phage 277E43-1]